MTSQVVSTLRPSRPDYNLTYEQLALGLRVANKPEILKEIRPQSRQCLHTWSLRVKVSWALMSISEQARSSLSPHSPLFGHLAASEPLGDSNPSGASWMKAGEPTKTALPNARKSHNCRMGLRVSDHTVPIRPPRCSNVVPSGLGPVLYVYQRLKCSSLWVMTCFWLRGYASILYPKRNHSLCVTEDACTLQ